MKRATEAQDKKTAILQGLTNFLSRNRRVLTSILIVVAITMVALVVVLTIRENQREEALRRVEELQSDYRDWLALPEEERGEAFDELASAAQQLASDFDVAYADTRAALIEADALFELERWDDAAAAYETAAGAAGDSYLGAVSLMGASAARENAGDSEAALVHLQAVVDDFGAQSSYTPRALFNVGRINEVQNNIVEASEAYNRLIDDYPTSSWTNLARNRIITLTIQGRIGEE